MQVIKAFGTERFEHDRVRADQRRAAPGGRGELPGRGSLRCPRRRPRRGRDRPRPRPWRAVRRRRPHQPRRPRRRGLLHQQAVQAPEGHRQAGQPRRPVLGPARAHRRDPVVGHGARRRHRRLEARPPGGGHGPARRRALPVRREPAGAERCLPARAQAAPDSHSSASPAPASRRSVPSWRASTTLARFRVDRRSRRAVVAVALGAQPGRRAAPGHDPVQRHASGTTSPTGPTPTRR